MICLFICHYLFFYGNIHIFRRTIFICDFASHSQIIKCRISAFNKLLQIYIII